MNITISLQLANNAMPDEIAFALREAARLAGDNVMTQGLLKVDEQRDSLDAAFINAVACAHGFILYRSE